MNLEAFKDLTRIEQTLFGLPFILSGVLLSIPDHSFSWITLFWVFLAFLSARVAGMAFNQLIDRNIDAKNPRTKNRAIPTGRVSILQARIVAIGSLILFLLICFRINSLCFILSPFAAFLLVIYSYLKRIHVSCHFVLGLIHFLGPVMAYAAFSSHVSLSSIFLGLSACMLIVGNDIVYAIQDYNYDTENHLHSIPSRIGIDNGLKLSFYLHCLCVIFLILAGICAKLPLVYLGASVVVGGVLWHFQSTVHRQYTKTRSVTGIESVFFFSNIFVSFSVLLFVTLSILWDVLF